VYWAGTSIVTGWIEPALSVPYDRIMANGIEGKICLVTGGARGIGRAITEMLLAEGASVAICARHRESVDRALQELGAKNEDKIAGKVADVGKHEDVAALFEFMDTRFGGLDVLINNAGVGVFGPVGSLAIEDWRSTIETNLSGAFYCSREAVARFSTRGGGYIINIGSLAGSNAFAGGAAYNASKFGLNGLSEAMMQDVRSQDVKVSTVAPGSVATQFGGHGADPGSDWRVWPEDVAEIVRMLLNMPPRTLVSRVEVRPSKPKK